MLYQNSAAEAATSLGVRLFLAKEASLQQSSARAFAFEDLQKGIWLERSGRPAAPKLNQTNEAGWQGQPIGDAVAVHPENEEKNWAIRLCVVVVVLLSFSFSVSSVRCSSCILRHLLDLHAVVFTALSRCSYSRSNALNRWLACPWGRNRSPLLRPCLEILSELRFELDGSMSNASVGSLRQV